MYLVATFEHSPALELALSALEQKRIAKEQILAIPLDLRKEEQKLFDNIHRSDGYSFIDGAALCCAFFMSFGTAIGFGLRWGPVIWGLIGMVSGFIIGIVADLLLWKKKRNRNLINKPSLQLSEVVLMVQCKEEQADWVEQLLWDHHALAIGSLEMSSETVSTA